MHLTTAFSQTLCPWRRIGMLSTLCAASALFWTAPVKAANPAAEAVAPEHEHTISQRWQDLRHQLWPEPVRPSVRGAMHAERFIVEKTTLEQVSAEVVADDSASPDSPETTAGANAVTTAGAPMAVPARQRSGHRNAPGAETRIFSDSTEPLATAPLATPPSRAPVISLPDFLAFENGSVRKSSSDLALPPEPVPANSGVAPIPEDPFPGEYDTVFRPITRIEPYYDYSPTGRNRYEYLCPQPSDTPDDQRARCPDIRPLPQVGSVERYFTAVNYCWVATDLHHKPLYFEDVSLERYGHKWPCGLQPFVSVGKFAGQFIALPYQMAFDPVNRDIYALGYYRPGDAAPELLYQVPFNAKAAAMAAGVYTGLVFLIP
jgi:hypothetical protein